MKFFFGILLAALVAVALADEEFTRPEIIPTTPKSPINIRDKRGFILGTYAAPTYAAVPVAIAATKETEKKPEIANLPATITKPEEKIQTESIAAVAAPAIATPLAYTYSAAVPYAYPAYQPYVPYYAYPAFYY